MYKYYILFLLLKDTLQKSVNIEGANEWGSQVKEFAYLIA